MYKRVATSRGNPFILVSYLKIERIETSQFQRFVLIKHTNYIYVKQMKNIYLF